MKISSVRSLVRPIVTILFALAIVYGFVKRIISGAEFLAIAGTVIAFWFAVRSDTGSGKNE